MSSSLALFRPTEPFIVSIEPASVDIVPLANGHFLRALTFWDTSAGSDRRSEHSSKTTAIEFDAEGNPQGGPIELFSTDGGQLATAFQSDVLADGSIVLSVVSRTSGGGGTATLLTRVLEPDGTPSAPPNTISHPLIHPFFQGERLVADDGSILLVTQQDSSILLQDLTTDGPPVTVVDDLGFGELVDFEKMPDGRVLVIWRAQNFESGRSFEVSDAFVAFRAAFVSPETGQVEDAFDLRVPDLSFRSLEELQLVGVDVTETEIRAIWSEGRPGVEISSSALTLERLDLVDGTPLGDTVPLGSFFGGAFEMQPLGNELYLLSWQGAAVYPENPSVVAAQVFDIEGRAIGGSGALFSRDFAAGGFIGVPSLTRVGDQIIALTSVDGDVQMRFLEPKATTEGTPGDDVLQLPLATSGYLLGQDGDDLLVGSEGDDVLDGGAGDDDIRAGQGNDVILGKGGNNTVDGGEGTDFLQLDVFQPNPSSTFDSGSVLDAFTFGENVLMAPDGTITFILEDASVQTFKGIEFLGFGHQTWRQPIQVVRETARGDHDYVEGSSGGDVLNGFRGDDRLMGFFGDDTLYGGTGNDVLLGGEGRDELHGGDGDDYIHGYAPVGGTPSEDRRDMVFAGSGDDTVYAGHGNDIVYGMDGNDLIAGGFGADELIGQNGDDTITGSAFSDLIFGNAGDDFVNGGFGFDRINGGDGADRFFHAGVDGHGSDWIQDFDASEGDVLVFGLADAEASDFVVRFNHTASADGERSGNDDVEEAFVNYRGQTIWALVDGAGQDEISVQIGGAVFDLLA